MNYQEYCDECALFGITPYSREKLERLEQDEYLRYRQNGGCPIPVINELRERIKENEMASKADVVQNISNLCPKDTVPLEGVESPKVYLEGVRFWVVRNTGNRDADTLRMDSLIFHKESVEMIFRLCMAFMFDQPGISIEEIKDVSTTY
jgi:hypothetical protein